MDASTEDLMTAFEAEVTNNFNLGLEARVRRSEMAKELIRRGRAVLGPIANRLRTIEIPVAKIEIVGGWAFLSSLIAEKHGISDEPDRFDNCAAWIAWAEKNAEPGPLDTKV